MIHPNLIISYNKINLQIILTQINNLIGIQFFKMNKNLRKKKIVLFMHLIYLNACNS
jgi:hypothetical protein